MAGNPGVNNLPPQTGNLLNAAGEVVNVADVLGAVYDAETGALKTTATLTGEITIGSIAIKDNVAANYQVVNAAGESSINLADGSAVTIGAKADTAVTNPATAGSVISFLKGILTKLGAVVLAAGTAVIGKVGIQVGGADVAEANPVHTIVTNNLTVGTSALPTGAATQTTLAAVNTTTGAKTDAASTDATSSWSIISILKGLFAQVAVLSGGYQTDQGFVTIDTAHYEVHEGEAFQSSHVFINVADNATVNIHITAGATKSAHANLSVMSIGKAYLKTYLNPTYSNVGTQALVAAMRTDVDPADRVCNVRYTATTSALGTQRLTKLIPGGTSSQTRVGAAFNSALETIISPNDDILVQVQNVSGASIDMEVSMTWYERTVA